MAHVSTIQTETYLTIIYLLYNNVDILGHKILFVPPSWNKQELEELVNN